MPPRKSAKVLSASGKSHMSKADLKKKQESEIHVDSDKIEAPAFLKGIAEHKKFNKLVDELLKVGLVTNIDCNALGRLVIANQKYEEIVKKLHSLDQEDPKYLTKLKTLSSLQQSYDKQILTLEREFGMTANSRSKMVVAKDPKAKDNALLQALKDD